MADCLTGVILAGGNSSRMGRDKALIDFNGSPQIYYLASLIKPFCNKILISRNKKQAEIPDNLYEIIFDDESAENQGPLTGLISAIEKYPKDNFLVMYCDLVNIENLIEILLNERDDDKFASCFSINNFPEPSIAIIESKANKILLEKYKAGKYSIIKFLKDFECKYITLHQLIIDKDE
ncbi:MAG: molybdenum cofactor guanylyltransferase [Ignavibacteria bacterium]|nr:molybdenum cofactor guanylyltransferase [Ignavibacteria bacterium]